MDGYGMPAKNRLYCSRLSRLYGTRRGIPDQRYKIPKRLPHRYWYTPPHGTRSSTWSVWSGAQRRYMADLPDRVLRKVRLLMIFLYRCIYSVDTSVDSPA